MSEPQGTWCKFSPDAALAQTCCTRGLMGTMVRIMWICSKMVANCQARPDKGDDREHGGVQHLGFIRDYVKPGDHELNSEVHAHFFARDCTVESCCGGTRGYMKSGCFQAVQSQTLSWCPSLSWCCGVSGSVNDHCHYLSPPPHPTIYLVSATWSWLEVEKEQ